MDIVVAILVFTHLQEEDALGYIKRIYDILKPGGRAILARHIVEERRKRPRFTSPNKSRIDEILEFATPLPPSQYWFTGTPDRPEDAIAFNREALDRLIRGKFELKSFMRGSTTGGYDPFLQDIIILERKV
jgi:SAM-dependent methyltransferase